MSQRRNAMICAALTALVFASFVPEFPVARADEGHTVRYVVTGDTGQEVSIYFRVAPQTPSWSGAHTENYWVSPSEPWEQTVQLTDPSTAYVAVRNVWWNPNMHCEIWIDGVKTMESSPNGVCIPRPAVGD